MLFVGMIAVVSLTRANESPRMPEDVFPQLGAILDEALKQSPRMLLQQLSLDSASGELIQAKSGLYPSIGGFYSQMETKDKREDMPGQTVDTSKTYYNVSLTQPIFHWGERINNARMGEIRSQIAQKRYAEAYTSLAAEIRSVYLNLISIKSQLVNAQFALKQANEALRSGEERAAQKLISDGAVFPLRISAEQAELNVATLESSFLFSQHHLEALTGQPAPALEDIPDEIPPQAYYKPMYDNLLGDLIEQKNPETPALEILRQQIEIDQLTYKNQRKRLLPKLSFVVGMSQDEQSYTINNAQKYGVLSKYVGLQVNWQIFDGLATRGAVRSALANKRQSEQSYRIARDNLQRTAQNAARNIALASRQMAISDKMLDNSQVYLDFRKEDFKRGNASEADVNQALANYYSARVSAINARINFLMKQVEFVSQIARDPAMDKVTFE